MASQKGFFDEEFRLEKITQQGDPLVRLNELIDWEMFRPVLTEAFRSEAKGPGGRPPFDFLMMFKILVLQRLYNLSDAQMEYQILDRFSFMRFLGLQVNDTVPDEKTIWYVRERLKEKGVIEKLFDRFSEFLQEKGVVTQSGRIVDASIVEVPKQRNRREENEQIREGKSPEGWTEVQKRHKDTDARWVTKRGVRFYGYKNHVKADIRTKLILRYRVTDASVHDSQGLEGLVGAEDAGQELYGDSAYSGNPIRKLLQELGVRDCIHEKGYRNRPLTEEQKERNRVRSKVRARVEHIFGFMRVGMKGAFLRTIGIRRAQVGIGLMNLCYNLCRYVQVQGA